MFQMLNQSSVMSISPLLDKRIATSCVLGKCDKTMVVIIKKSTQINIPATPQIVPQNARLNAMTSGLRFNDVPINRGSILFPIVICSATIQTYTIQNSENPTVVDCANAMVAGNIVATIDPKVRIKLSKNLTPPISQGSPHPSDSAQKSSTIRWLQWSET